MRLHDSVRHFAQETPSALAVHGPDGSLTYAELDRKANQFARLLQAMGVREDDRVGLWLEKSTVAVAAMQAVLRLGAAYVPVDPFGPTSRSQTILSNCSIRALVTTQSRAESMATSAPWDSLCVDSDEARIRAESAAPVPESGTSPNDLAYILYTSGSTGTPKGVCLSHRNALAFVEWGAKLLGASSADRFANHAPMHFDLSVFDLYAAFLVGGSSFLIPDGLVFSPRKLVEFVIEHHVTVWYSVPSALVMMMNHGGLLDEADTSLRAILFAGEVFPVAPLRQLRRHWPKIRLLNLYGPTETNVCTYYEVDSLSDDQVEPVPIGQACCGNRIWALSETGKEIGPEEIGELFVDGPTVMLGYWGKEPQGAKPYATGDLVRVLEDGGFRFLGRKDQMVKIRGHRVELEEIETVLHRHPAVREVAVAVENEGIDARLYAFVATDQEHPTLLTLKKLCSEHLPRYMIIDGLRLVDTLPRTRNGKINRGELVQLLRRSQI